jgi:hypothetical protein
VPHHGIALNFATAFFYKKTVQKSGYSLLQDRKVDEYLGLKAHLPAAATVSTISMMSGYVRRFPFMHVRY